MCIRVRELLNFSSKTRLLRRPRDGEVNVCITCYRSLISRWITHVMYILMLCSIAKSTKASDIKQVNIEMLNVIT